MYSQWLNPDLNCNVLLVSNNEEALQRQHILEEKLTMNLIESVESQYLKSTQRVQTTYTPTETCLYIFLQKADWHGTSLLPQGEWVVHTLNLMF